MRRPRQHGAALIVLVLILVLGSLWYIVSRIHARPLDFTAANRAHNAAVLNEAKQALIGYVVARAAKDDEDNPGALPCPEHAWYIDLPDKEGGAGPSIGVANPGYGTANCSSIGRFPWRTVGTDKLVDASGEPLWYVVGPTWRKTSNTTDTDINSNTPGDLTADGEQVVALIIAPGPAINVQAGTTASGVTCTARNQIRSAPTGTMDPLDYLECYDAATQQFSATGPSGSFNDQVVKITTADLMPGIEAAVANRIERDIVPQLRSLYASTVWAPNLSTTNPLYPYPAPFADPSATTSYQGSATSCSGNVCRGLLPVVFTNAPGSSSLCTPSAGSPCDPNFVRWTSGTVKISSFSVLGTTYTPANTGGLWNPPATTCTVGSTSGSPSTSQLNCTGYVPGVDLITDDNVTFEIDGVAANVAMALRQFNSTTTTGVSATSGGSSQAVTLTTPHNLLLASTGSATLTIKGSTTAAYNAGTVPISLCGLSSSIPSGTVCKTITFSVPINPFLSDAPLLDSSGTYGWFMRNEWFRLTYFAVAQGYTATSLPGAMSCGTGTTCLSAANVTPAGAQRALLILAGRSINGVARPSSALEDYLEFGNASGNFERETVTMAFNSNAYADSGTANAYVVALNAVPVGSTFQFRAANTSTGASTLTTSATGTLALKNVDGSDVAAGGIVANGLVEVLYDGTKFVVTGRPFNDRLIVVDAN